MSRQQLEVNLNNGKLKSKEKKKTLAVCHHHTSINSSTVMDLSLYSENHFAVHRVIQDRSLPILDGVNHTGIVGRLVDLEECALRLGDDGLVDRIKVLEELVDVGGVDCEGEVDADSWIRRHCRRACQYSNFPAAVSRTIERFLREKG